MAKKPRTAKQLANDERLRQMAAERKAKGQEETPRPEPTTAPELPEQPEKKVEVPESLLYKLMNEIEELKKNTPKASPEENLAASQRMQGVVSAQGFQGQIFKYPIEKDYYPDPTERLYEEPRLKRMALRENFIFEWDVEGVEYEQHGISYAEPRFIVELSRKLFDDQGNERLDKKAFVNRIYLHEDEVVARRAARKFGLGDMSPKDLLDEMRYIRMRDWLLAIFYPEQIKTRSADSTMIIDGKPVTIQDREEFVDAAGGIGMADTVRRQTAL